MRNERKVRKGSTMSCQRVYVNISLDILFRSSTDHQLRFPLSDVEGPFALNEPGVHPDLYMYVLLS